MTREGRVVDASSGNGELRAALESVLTSRLQLDVAMRHLSERLDNSSRNVGRALAGAGERGLRIAEDVLAGARVVRQNAMTSFGDAAGAMDRDSHDVLDLLGSLHGHLPPPADARPSAAGLSAAKDANRFAAGFPRDYAGNVIGDLDFSWSITKEQADAIPTVSPLAPPAAVLDIANQFSGPRRQQVLDLFRDPHCHAVQQHGPDITPEQHAARLLWEKDPSGKKAWHIRPEDGHVITKFNSGPSTGGFTHTSGFARSITPLLDAADSHAGGLDGLLDANSADGKMAAVFVSAETAGLGKGDAVDMRGVGTNTPEGRFDWSRARRLARRNGGPPVRAVSYDPFVVGRAPGANIVFKKVDGTWRLYTCHPVTEYRSNQVRLEDLA